MFWFLTVDDEEIGRLYNKRNKEREKKQRFYLDLKAVNLNVWL